MKDSAEDILNNLPKALNPFGLETHPFKIGWYNDAVGKQFKLDYPEDCLSFLIVSTPFMFDRVLKPFLLENEDFVRDPVDECIRSVISDALTLYPTLKTSVLYDYDLDFRRRPRVLVQTAAHVSGAAYYYQDGDVQQRPWPADQSIFGVCIHPKFGGWFALRAVVIFEDVVSPDLVQREAPDVVPDQQDRINLLTQHNFNWQDMSYRDIVPTVAKYSEEQQLYFKTPPAKRQPIIDRIRTNFKSELESTSALSS